MLCACAETPPPKRWGVLSQAAKQPTCQSCSPQRPWHCDKEETEARSMGEQRRMATPPRGTHTNLLLHPLPVPPPQPLAAGSR